MTISRCMPSVEVAHGTWYSGSHKEGHGIGKSKHWQKQQLRKSPSDSPQASSLKPARGTARQRLLSQNLTKVKRDGSTGMQWLQTVEGDGSWGCPFPKPKKTGIPSRHKRVILAQGPC
jgi:hypothetical protein